MQTVEIRSSSDGVLQAVRWWAPAECLRSWPASSYVEPVPLVVALHTWSGDYRQDDGLKYFSRARPRGWPIIFPDFRGPNRNPMACASVAAVSDIADAVEYAKSVARIDERRIYLVGASGGGHMSLVMAHSHPGIWAAVSSWVPISDLAAWHGESVKRETGYAKDLEAVCGGPPGAGEAVDRQYRARSPLFHLEAARGVNIHISAGIHDGHTGSVPVSHTLLAFNRLAEVNGFPEKAVAPSHIQAIVDTERVPGALGSPPNDASMPSRVLFRREAGPARVTLFEGGHEIFYDAAFEWLAKHTRQA